MLYYVNVLPAGVRNRHRPTPTRIVCLAVLYIVSAQHLDSWPAGVYPEIFEKARRTLPDSFQQLLIDLEPILYEPCAFEPDDAAEGAIVAAEGAISMFRDPNGSPAAAVAALRDAGCAVAAMNDPGMDTLVEDQASRFSVVFYGWHPAIQDGDLAGYLESRRTELETLADRYQGTSALPTRSDAVEVSPEFGMASIAYSHAVTDVANVWLYVWTSVNGAF